jgi:cobyrinic acid a,c-diamide synthase
VTQAELPKIVVTGLAGDAGKSLVSLGLARAFTNQCLKVAPFKKGPDFIDASWLGAAANAPGRNLDTFMMPTGAIFSSLAKATGSDLAIVEGNRGIFDGINAQGSYSTAELAKLIGAPVILIVNVTKATRTVAALVKGCQALDPELHLGGVILNRVGTARQEKVIREAVTSATGVPVIGAIPRLMEQHLPSRHLGLVTAIETEQTEEVLETVSKIVTQYVELDSVLSLARKTDALPDPKEDSPATIAKASGLRIGVAFDKAFSFYYPENIEILEEAGAEIVYVSPMESDSLPPIDALYLGGGFPEVHAAALTENQVFRDDLAKRIADGLPVWAECGGLMYLAETITMDGCDYPMVGALPIAVEQMKRPQGHGYVSATITSPNPFIENGTRILGHEFHYSRLRGKIDELATIMTLDRGKGLGSDRDGIRLSNVVATYTHIHALATPEWTTGLVQAAKRKST